MVFLSKMKFWRWDLTPHNFIVWLYYSIDDLKGCSANLLLSIWYLLILTPNVAAHLSKTNIPAKVSYWFVILIRCTYIKSLKWYTITLAAQVLTVVSLTDNCVTNTVWYDWSCSTEIADSILFSVYFIIYLYLFPFVIHWLLLDVLTIHDAQRGTSSFNYRNLDWRTPTFSSLNMDLRWRWDKFPYQDFNYCCKGDNTSVKHDIINLFLCEIILFVNIILWGNWNWSNVWHIPGFEELLNNYHCVFYKEINDVLIDTRIIVVYVHQIHQLIVSLISVS